MLEREIKISVIIPVYNVEKYLKKCIDSILNQTFQDFEIIFIDDGSTDKSLKILEEYKNKDYRFIILKQAHKGASAARNKGIELARGKYVIFLDSDDYFEPTLLEDLFSHAEDNNTEITICSSKKVDDSGLIIETGSPNFPINIDKIPMEQIFNWKNFKEDIFCLLAPVIWNRLFLKDFLINNNLRFPNLPIYEDIGFVHCTTASATKMIAFNKELINYRFNRPKSLVSTRSKHTIEAVKSCLYLKEFLKSKKIYNELETAYENAIINHIRAEISYCDNDEYNKFLEEFKQLLPNDWAKYSQALRKDYITPEYLKNFIGDKKVMLWGASLFIKQVLEKETEKNPNILGIIDKNRSFEGELIGNYKIFAPEAINELKPDGVILTVLSNNEIIYEILKKDFNEKYQDVELLPNIFEKELEWI